MGRRVLPGLAATRLGTFFGALSPVARFLPSQRVSSAIIVGAGVWLVLQSGILPRF